MNKLKAVLFDLDGTLRDSREAIVMSIEKVFNELGIPQPQREELVQHVHRIQAVHKAFAPDHPVDDFVARYHAHLTPLAKRAKLYTNAREILTQLKDDGYKLGLVSSARAAKQWAEDDDMLPLFSMIIGPEDTKKHKPDPEPILKALDELGCSADEVVMVGDLAADIQAAKHAHLHATIGITHGFGSYEMLEQSGADHIIESLIALPELVSRLDR